ncbi:hypothetical protein BC629DRAFT_1668235 [Irpex lacteus]|nr:hypothetical protein BC629DRAFT_1668235 [Irpex lacteus]
MTLTSLPTELIEEILARAIELHPHPAQILRTHSVFNEIGSYILYSHLHFNSIGQLSAFVSHKKDAVPHQPRELTVNLAGGTTAYTAFQYLGDVLKKSANTCDGHAPASAFASALPLDLLSLRLNSHVNNPNLHDIYDALILANPRRFSWLGPDPGHHFSIAIVPTACFHLFRAISTWTLVEEVTLTNIAFFSDSDGSQPPSTENGLLFPSLPRLQCLYLGQATFLSPSRIAMMAIHSLNRYHEGSLSCTEYIRLVDAYQESIWGPRLRRTDIEKAALALPICETYGAEVVLEHIRSSVRCEAMNDRIMGGDRSEGLTVLE